MSKEAEALIAPRRKVAGLTIRPLTPSSLIVADMVGSKFFDEQVEELTSGKLFTEVVSFLYMQTQDRDTVYEKAQNPQEWKKAVLEFGENIKLSDIQKAAEDIAAIINESMEHVVEPTESESDGEKLTKKNSIDQTGSQTSAT